MMTLNPQRIRVPAGFLFGAAYLYLGRPTRASAVAGVLVTLCGILVRIWAAGCIEKGRELEMRGPYRLTRNPLYFGSFLIGLGASIASASPAVLVLFLILFGAIYVPVMRREEGELAGAFPESFPSYSRAVPRFWPRPFATPEPAQAGSGRVRFQWERAWRNRDYNAVAGFVAWTAWICFRLWSR